SMGDRRFDGTKRPVSVVCASESGQACDGKRSCGSVSPSDTNPQDFAAAPCPRPISVEDMEVRFTKSEKGRTCSWEALRPPRTKVPGPAMAAGADLPHDLATFVIEEALGIERGFWGSVAEGATFRSLG